MLIAGAGIGGLATALALAKRGIASHVLERRATFAEEGAGIQIGPNGTKLLAHLGVADALRPLVAAPVAIRVHDGATGRSLAELPLNPWIEQRHGAPYWTLHRQDLHAALLARARAVPLIRLTAGAEVVSVSDGGGRLAARTRDGRSLEGDALVAADGIWSRTRHAQFDATPPRFTGKSALRAVIPSAALPRGLDDGAVHLWLSANAHVVHYPVRGGAETAIVVVIDEPEAAAGWSTPVEASVVRSHVAGFALELRELLAQPDAWRKWSLHALPRLGRLARGRIALLGDAAHPVVPFLAQGAVMAMEDGVVLADCLAAESEVRAALASYERQRRRRVARVAAASRRNGIRFHHAGVLAAARNAMLAAVPGSLMMARYDWLYGWEAR